MKLLVISICKDESETIGKVLDGIPKNIPGITRIEKWVIDDGSVDDTPQVARNHGAQVIADGVNKKLAFRFREALDLALNNNADVLVNIDGDMQFNPADIPKFIKPIVDDEADFVAADRFTNPETGSARRPENMPLGKYLGNRLGTFIVGRLSKQNFADVTCGFRAYNRNALIALNINSEYTYTQESFQVLAMKKLRIQSVPVKVTYFAGRKSRVVKGFSKFVLGSAINILRAYRDYAPLRFFGILGFLFFLPGTLLIGFTGMHWLNTGAFSPYKAFGLTGLYLFTMSLFIWAIGLVADMLDRSLNNQEKILEITKKAYYAKKDTNKKD